jgi:DNA-damage-inducible protein D
MQPQPAIFEEHEIRRVYDEATETWWFSVVDIVQVLTQQADYQAARNYWKVLKNRLSKEGSESVTKCNRLIAACQEKIREEIKSRSARRGLLS